MQLSEQLDRGYAVAPCSRTCTVIVCDCTCMHIDVQLCFAVANMLLCSCLCGPADEQLCFYVLEMYSACVTTATLIL